MKVKTIINTSLIKGIVIFILCCSNPTFADNGDYWKARDNFIKQEESKMLGSSIVLNEKEQIANKILMGYKLKEYDAGCKNPETFAPAKHFFQSKNDIEKSKVFKFLQKMPKGAALHGHDTSIVSQEFLYELTFKDNLYACTVNKRLLFKFLENPQQDNTCNWTSVSALRQQDPNINSWIKSQMTLNVTDPKVTYRDINVAWKVFMEVFSTVDSMILYKPVFQEHFYQALKELYADNVLYLEYRGTLPKVYDLNGTTYGPMEVTSFYQEVIQQFKQDYPDFIGARFIYAPLKRRDVDNTTALEYVKIVSDLKDNFPDLLAGFDLVGQEDIGRPLEDFLAEFKEISSKGINFYFHAGETDWYGTSTDFNLVDAVLLGSKRIGHGYALSKHPLVLEQIKEQKIAIEVCPISNQVLMLVDDLRNHPASSYIAQGYPVVISYDDPSFWGAKGLSYDFYMAFMGLASRRADLRLLKQLAMNSLMYSSLPTREKDEAIDVWNKQWDRFVDDVVSNAQWYMQYSDKSGSAQDISVLNI